MENHSENNFNRHLRQDQGDRRINRQSIPQGPGGGWSSFDARALWLTNAYRMNADINAGIYPREGYTSRSPQGYEHLAPSNSGDQIVTNTSQNDTPPPIPYNTHPNRIVVGGRTFTPRILFDELRRDLRHIDESLRRIENRMTSVTRPPNTPNDITTNQSPIIDDQTNATNQSRRDRRRISATFHVSGRDRRTEPWAEERVRRAAMRNRSRVNTRDQLMDMDIQVTNNTSDAPETSSIPQNPVNNNDNRQNTDTSQSSNNTRRYKRFDWITPVTGNIGDAAIRKSVTSESANIALNRAHQALSDSTVRERQKQAVKASHKRRSGQNRQQGGFPDADGE